MGKKVRVLVVDDSLIVRQLVSEVLRLDPDIEIAGTAANGSEALERLAVLKPDVITMDVDMPVMDGLTAVEHIMAERPTPILLLTGDPRYQAPELTYRALELGALALQIKPSIDSEPEAWNLAREVKLLASVKVIRHVRGKVRGAGSAGLGSEPQLAAGSMGIVAVAASTGGPPVLQRLGPAGGGGPQVLQRMVSELPRDFPAPIVIVQHINAAFADSLATWMGNSSKLKVRLAQDGDALQPGTVLIAPPGQHLTIPYRGRVALQSGSERDGHMPSGTVLLESAARAYGRRAVGLILTGMGADGAEGMLAIKRAGGLTLGQSEESCVVFGMPGAAVKLKAVDHLIHADEVASTLVRLARGESR